MFKTDNIIKPRFADIFVLLIPIVAAIILLNVFVFAKPNSDKNQAQIIVDGKIVRAIDLSGAKNEVIELDLECGNIVEIKDEKIGVRSADCKDKTCVKTGYISRAGEIVVCVPSRLIIKIVGESSADAITG